MNKKCLGCGIIMQNDNPLEKGYVVDLNDNICERCFKLKNYGQYEKVSLDNQDFEEILNEIPDNSLVVYLTSLFNLNLSYVNRFKNVIVVLTKRDLLPKSLIDDKIINYVKDKLNIKYLDIEIISSIKNYNLDSLMNKINKYKNNNDVYFVGMTNSGKSTLINKLIKNYGDNESVVTTSMYPSTTLNKVELEINGTKIIDTPGLLSNGSILNYISLKEIKNITPKKEIKPRSYQLKGKGSLIIDNYIRINYYSDNNIVLYLANSINITKTGLNNPKLLEEKKYNFNINNDKDIVIEDLCFIKFTRKCNIEIYSKYPLNIYDRDKLC